jgi:hypothetical protein
VHGGKWGQDLFDLDLDLHSENEITCHGCRARDAVHDLGGVPNSITGLAIRPMRLGGGELQIVPQLIQRQGVFICFCSLNN